MRALRCHAFGSLDNLAVEEVPSPRPGAGQVLLDVKAASLNFPDVLMAQGLYQVKPSLPYSPGAEAAGVVLEVGAGAMGVRPGERVISIAGWGGFAEECAVDADRVTPLPDGMDFETGAALLYTFGTALHALRDRACLREGETLLVLGAGGGTGLAAVAVGKALGARVLAAASTDEKLALCRDAGADLVVHYGGENLRDRVRELTGGRGADVVFDPVGGPYTEPALRATAWGGRLLVIGFAAGEIPRIRLNLALLRERSIVGVYWGEWARHDPEGHGRNTGQLVDWFASGVVRPVIRERVPLDGAADAMRRMANRQIQGKVVILPEA